VQLLCQDEGDEIFPYWDEYGDLIAFTRKYTKKLNGKDTDSVDIWTSDTEIHAQRIKGEWIRDQKPNPYGKIPVIYYEQAGAEWGDVQSVIDRIEMLISKNADANDYFSNPTVKLKGELKDMPKKDEVAKLLQFKLETVNGQQQYGDAEYLTWDRAVESIKSEYEMLKDIAHSQTYTPDLSFNNVKGMGNNLSGIVFEFMFMDAMLKSNTKREMLVEGLERRVNLLKEMLSVVDAEFGQKVKTDPKFEDLEVFFEFEDIMPKNVSELIDNINKAIEGKSSMSRKRAVELNPLVTDPIEEMKQIEQEDEQAQEALAPEGESFNLPNQDMNKKSA
jgi:SPP1 family phage portal protein